MTYKAPKTIAAEEIKMTKLALRHIFCTQSYLRWVKTTARTRAITASIHEKGHRQSPRTKIRAMPATGIQSCVGGLVGMAQQKGGGACTAIAAVLRNRARIADSRRT